MKLNKIPIFKNNTVVNITDESLYSNLNLSDEYGHVDLNSSILRLTNQVRKNIKSAKEDFDNFIPRTDEKEKFKNSQKIFESNDITTEKKPIRNNSSQVSDGNMTSTDENPNDVKIEIESSHTGEHKVPGTLRDDSPEGTYGEIDVTNSIAHIRMLNNVEIHPTYDIVGSSTEINLTPDQEGHVHCTNSKISATKTDNQGNLNNSKLTSKEDDYKKILLSIISSLNKLDINDDQLSMTNDSFDICIQPDDKIDTFSDLNGSTVTTQIGQHDPPDESSSSSDSSTSSSSSESNSSTSNKHAKSTPKSKSLSKLSDSKFVHKI